MKESIYTIPVSEVFEPKDDCPLCKMRDILEQRCVEYILGAAMMEPDIRQETNRLGFCLPHFQMMLRRKNRLSLALVLESHLNELYASIEQGKQFEIQRKKNGNPEETCYVCSQIDWAMERMLKTVVDLWTKEETFRNLFAEQSKLCVRHYRQLCSAAAAHLKKKDASAFEKEARQLTLKALGEIKEDVSHFCKMFDYRNNGAGADWGNSRDSAERAIWYLTSRKPDGQK